MRCGVGSTVDDGIFGLGFWGKHIILKPCKEILCSLELVRSVRITESSPITVQWDVFDGLTLQELLVTASICQLL